MYFEHNSDFTIQGKYTIKKLIKGDEKIIEHVLSIETALLTYKYSRANTTVLENIRVISVFQ